MTPKTAPAHAAVTLPRITAILNQKGGVGKTGLTAGTGGALSERGRRTLLVDLDPQGHLTTEALGLEEADSTHPNLAAALTGEFTGPTSDLVVQHSQSAAGGCLDVLPHCVSMFLVVRKLHAARSPEHRLTRVLRQLEGSYDHVLIDCPPSLDVLTDTALVASDGLLVPVQPSNTSLRALRLLIEQVAVIEEELQIPRRDLHGLVPGVYRRPLSGIARYKMQELEEYGVSDGEVPALPILAHLPLAAAVEEAWLSGQTLTDYQPAAPIADAYRRIALHLDVAAGLSSAAELEGLPALETVTPSAVTSSTAEGK
ncbi:chromosome partitioning protein [Pseudonocardia ammonioxydans]|uniref:Chromosome partitioning protein n=1 Tax=Pseudonocardia ammonioxydans TaxID=260086 RepID=A0A1I5IS53_PSUAM|nr:ParA family protein [Pseudonocardia ammonioxydans]SFO63200.1 chromosome partitioning protein [Pseudonocardia ammonioxydans]